MRTASVIKSKHIRVSHCKAGLVSALRGDRARASSGVMLGEVLFNIAEGLYT